LTAGLEDIAKQIGNTQKTCPVPSGEEGMKTLDWITSGISATIAALSTAPPNQWVDGRVMAVASTTFLLNALQAHRTKNIAATKEEIGNAVRLGLVDIEKKITLNKSATENNSLFIIKLKDNLTQNITEMAEKIEECDGQLNKINKVVGNLIDRVQLLEIFYQNAGSNRSCLIPIIDKAYQIVGISDQNRLHEILNEKFDVNQLRIIAGRIGLDWDNIRGETKEVKALEMIIESNRSKIVTALVKEIERRRPGVLNLEYYPPGGSCWLPCRARTKTSVTSLKCNSPCALNWQ